MKRNPKQFDLKTFIMKWSEVDLLNQLKIQRLKEVKEEEENSVVEESIYGVISVQIPVQRSGRGSSR